MKTVKVPLDAENSYRFAFVPTFEMAPRVDVIIYCVEDAYLLSKRLSIDLRGRLENSIEVTANRSVATSVDVIVRSNPKAFVGLVGVDQSTLLLSRGNDLVHVELWKHMEAFHTDISHNRHERLHSTHRNQPKYVNYFDAFNDAGLILFTNAKIPEQPMSRFVLGSEMHPCSEFSLYPSLKKVRNIFPETWLWQTIRSDQFNGNHSLQTNRLTAIKSWIIFGFAIDADHGLAITNAPTNQAIHKPFFVTFKLPRSAKCGDTISIACTVLNYLEKEVDAEVSLENMHNEFVFGIDESMPSSSTGTNHSRNHKITISPDDGTKVNFVIRLTKVGL